MDDPAQNATSPRLAPGTSASRYGDAYLVAFGLAIVFGVATVLRIAISQQVLTNGWNFLLAALCASFFGAMYFLNQKAAGRKAFEASLGYTTTPYAHRELPELDWKSGHVIRAAGDSYLGRAERRERRLAVRRSSNG